MPLKVVERGVVVYKAPTQEELPVIGRCVCLNDTLSMIARANQIRAVSESMYKLQSALLKEKRNDL